MRREFKIVGKIDENTPVLGTTYGQVREAMRAGFEEQFSMIGRGHGVDKLAEQYEVQRQQAFEQISEQAALLREQAAKLEGWVSIQHSANADLQAAMDEISSLFGRRTVRNTLLGGGALNAGIGHAAIQSTEWTTVMGGEALNVAIGQSIAGPLEHVSLGYTPIGVEGALVPDVGYQATVLGGHLVLKKGTSEQVSNTAQRRRAEDKELNR